MDHRTWTETEYGKEGWMQLQCTGVWRFKVLVYVCVWEREREREGGFQQLVDEVSALETDGIRSYVRHVNHTAQRGDVVQRAGFLCFTTIFFADIVILLKIKIKVEGAVNLANELTNL